MLVEDDVNVKVKRENYIYGHYVALLHKSAAVNFYDFFLFAQFDSESFIDYKSDGIISGMRKKDF